MKRLPAVLALLLVACAAQGAPEPTETRAESTTSTSPPSTSSTSSTTSTTTSTTTTVPPTTTTTLVPPDGLDAAGRTLVEVETITGDIAPKSVVASGTGLFLAQNMMYRHTITAYDREYRLVATIDDQVTPAEFGHGDDFPATYRGSPVEAAFTSDGAHAYVSNYHMYGGGLSEAAGDGCDRGNWPDSFVYRIDTSDLEVDQLLRVGPVPKYLAVSPDDRRLLVANWCGFDVSILDLASGEEVTRVPVGRHPRGIAITGDSRTAYVAVMGSSDIAVVDLDTYDVDYLEGVGSGPRSLILSPDDRFLYATLNSGDRLVKVDLDSSAVVGSVTTGDAPRSMAMSDDGTALYVVNYNSDTMSKVRTSDMVETEEHDVSDKPIGITYDAPTREVWVSAYSGTIEVFVDTAPEGSG